MKDPNLANLSSSSSKFVLLLSFGLFLSVGFAKIVLFAPYAAWGLGYSDVEMFYLTYGDISQSFSSKTIEYPVLTSYFIHFMGYFSQPYPDALLRFQMSNLFFLSLSSALTVFVVHKMLSKSSQATGKTAFLLLSPTFVFFTYFNWDSLAVFPLVLSTYFLSRKRHSISSALLGLAAGFKLLPALAAPFYAVSLGKKPGMRYLTVFFASVAVIFVTPLLLGFEHSTLFMQYNRARPPNPDSLWGLIAYHVPSIGTSSVNLMSALLMALAYAFVFLRAARLSAADACMSALSVFLLFNKVFSPQYGMWLIPFFVLSKKTGFSHQAFFEASNFLVLLSIFAHYATGALALLTFTHLFVVLRALSLVYVLVAVLFRA